MRTERVYLDGIETLERLRPLHTDRVSAIKSSIEEIGLRTPLTVMAKPDGEDTRMILVAGHHRLEALRQIGEEATECFVIDDDEIDAKLWEIAENLCRAGLSKEERDEHIRRYAELLEARGAREARRKDDGSRVSTQIASKSRVGRPQGITSKIAEETGVSKDTVRRALNPNRVKSERARASIDADVKSRAAKEVAEIIAEHVPGEWWDAVKSNLYAAGAKNVADALTNITGQSIMDRRYS